MTPIIESARGDRRGRRPRTIALIGVDGSGKTTQAHRLADALTAAGLPATYQQNAGGRAWFGRIAQRLGAGDAQGLFGRHGWPVVESVLRWLAIARALVRSRRSGHIAVMDRYSYCQYASIRTQLGRGRREERLARFAYRLFPAPDVTFLLVVSPGAAYRRIEARGTDHETIEYLTRASASYASLPEHDSFVLIDGDGTEDEVAAEILAHLIPPAEAPAPPVTPVTGDLRHPVTVV
ncbi:dTMP kinase [Catenuloplanes atrovinosus]|uniref:Thymidylate kinase n=1 Tax=Catenuloplanes atrovinosus TaxID=137266 RepID=A0AAE4CC61_9ACTN|nr:dTMP kinase [Catenuloplanes atrovinosus]MDR7278818.1 dTMP kinase [Catenuloplanes atrovinosus]